MVDFESEIGDFDCMSPKRPTPQYIPSTDRTLFTKKEVLHWIAYLLLASTTLVITINSYDSGFVKTPLLVLFASLLVMVFLSQAVWCQQLEARRSPADAPVLLFLFLIIISPFVSEYSWNSWQAIAIWVPFIISFFAGTQLFTTHRNLDRLIRALAVIASIVCLIGLVVYFFANALPLEFFIGKDRRVISTLTNATYLSGYIVLLFPTLLAFTMAKERTVRERWGLITLLCSLLFILVVTSTRSSIAALVVSVILLGILLRRTRKNMLIWTIVGLFGAAVVAVVVSPNLIGRIQASFSTDSSSSLARRLYFWEAGRDAFKAAPYFGHGLGSYETVMLEYRSPEYWIVKSEDIVPHAHNELIETAVELGGAGVILYLLILGTLVVAGVKAGPKENERDRLLRAGLLCSLVAIVIDNLTNMSLRVAPVGATAWLLMGVLASLPARQNTQIVTALHSPRWISGVPLIAWVVFAFWYGSQQWNAYRADGHIIKGMLAGQSNDVALSISEYQQAVTLDTHTLLARSNLALALLIEDRATEAIEATRELQALSPRYPKSNLVEAAALVSLHRYTEALQKIEFEITLRSHPDAYFYQALAYKGLSDSTGELSSLEHLLRACIKGHLPYMLDFASTRIRKIARKEDERRFKYLYEQLSVSFPTDGNVAATLAELRSRFGEPKK